MGGREQLRLTDRLLAEAVRALERDGAAPIVDRAAADAARRQDGDLETRIAIRASALPAATALRSALRGVGSISTWTVVGAAVIAAVSGAGAVRAALGAPGAGSVNFFLVLISVLGVQSLLLAGWFTLMIARPRAANVSPLGAVALAAARWLATRGRHGPVEVAAVEASAGVNARGATGRWTLSALSHGLWVSFNTGCLVALVVLLSTKQYTFHWETTILSSRAYERITLAVAALPEIAGFPAPDAAQIAATEKDGGAAPPEAARAWSGLLVGAVVVYGFAPRLLLLGGCLSARRRARSRFRLDLSAPGYLRLRPHLMPAAERSGPGEDGASAQAPPSPGVALASVESGVENGLEGGGAPAIVGIEIEPPASGWPPRLHALAWRDLGFADGRDDRHRVCDDLAAMDERPRHTIMVCAIATTPDRGMQSFVEDIRRAAAGPVALVLTGGQAMRERGQGARIEQRVQDWRTLAAHAGVASVRVVEIDLDHLTDANRGRLAALVGAGEAPAPARRIEAAFDLIAGSAGAADARAQADLHKRIAALYESESRTLAGLFPGLRDVTDVSHVLERGADRVRRLLPDHLRRSPKWLAAGAVSGALGCVAIGTLVAPAAFAALPIWTMSGAGLGGLLQALRAGGGDVEAEAPPTESVATCVRAATLFALLLELQGRDEAAITRVLEQAVPDVDGLDRLEAGDEKACRVFLDDVRHRLDLALAREATR